MSSDDEDPSEREVRAITLRYLERATPAQWHVFAARSNYDGNRHALRRGIFPSAILRCH